jgi:hypothetical protein
MGGKWYSVDKSIQQWCVIGAKRVGTMLYIDKKEHICPTFSRLTRSKRGPIRCRGFIGGIIHSDYRQPQASISSYG